jgi:hypothetical protein
MMDKLKEAIAVFDELISLAESVDSWESFPSEPIEKAREALAALSALQAQEPVAWMNKSGSNIIPASAKQRLLESRGLGGEFSVAARTAERYTIPLYASPPVERGKPHTLRSYQYGNASTDLATSMADRIDAALAEKGQGK